MTIQGPNRPKTNAEGDHDVATAAKEELVRDATHCIRDWAGDFSCVDHLENCLNSHSGSFSDLSTINFFAHLSSETGDSAEDLKDIFISGLNEFFSEIQGIYEDLLALSKLVDLDKSDNDDLIFCKCIEAFSLVQNFGIAYRELIPPVFKEKWDVFYAKASEFLEVTQAIEKYPQSVRSIDTPVIRCRMYNFRESSPDTTPSSR